MPLYTYKAKDGPGKVVDGTVEATSINQALSKIAALGLSPVSVNQNDEKVSFKNEGRAKKRSGFRFSNQIKRTDIVMFTLQIGDLLEASVPLLRSLQSVMKQTQNPQLKNIIEKMTVYVRDGGSFSDALAQHPKVFSPLYVSMTKTGELAGNLDQILLRLGAYLEKENETINKVRSSLAYPALIVVVGMLTIFVLLTFVIPRITVMFSDLDQTLPVPTIMLIGISDFFARYWWVLLILIVSAVLLFYRWISRADGRLQFDRWKLKAPIIGGYVETVEIGRLAKTLATLLEGGVTITTALNSVWPTVDNKILQAQLKEVAVKVNQGSSLRAALSESEYFPEIAVNMMASGEETGQLEKGLYKIADIFEKQSDQLSKTMVSLLGPVVLIFIIGIVGFVVISMLLPIFEMNLIIQ